MIRKLMYLTTLLLPLLPGVAHCADPSADVSVNVVPAGPSAPAGAAAAGFTTLALNSDFTQQMPAGWLGGCANPGDYTPVNNADDGKPHSWWLNLWWSQNYYSCAVGQVADPAFGGLVLDMPWWVDNAYGNVGTVLETASWDYNANGGWPASPQGQSNDYPNNAYYEVTLRQTPIGAGVYSVLNTWGPLGIAPAMNSNGSSQTIEWDAMEIETGNIGHSDAAVHNWGNSGTAGGFLWCGIVGTGCGGFPAPGGLPSNFDTSQYHTYGMRVTSDGTNMEGCAYVDNKLINCIPVTLNAFQKVSGRNFLVLQNACDWWNLPSNGCTQGQRQDLYVKSVRVWSCASWQTAQCNGPVLSGAP
jgi:hypothetical protein